MDSPLGPIITNVFTVNLERRLVPTLKHRLNYWKHYETIMCITWDQQNIFCPRQTVFTST